MIKIEITKIIQDDSYLCLLHVWLPILSSSQNIQLWKNFVFCTSHKGHKT